MVLNTAEVRWCYSGEMPFHLRDWFLGLDDDARSEPPRVDHYLLVRDTDALGIKFREGRIEVKQRFGDPRRATFRVGATGTIEQWRKWGFPLASAGEERANLEAMDAWMAVEKDRWLRDYRVDAKGTIWLLEAPDLTIPTCSVELTSVRVQGWQGWTLAFEAAGPAATLVPTLEQVAGQVLSTLDDFELRPQDAFGYPRWLQIIAF